MGRSTERARLAEVWRSALEGERQLVVVAGEPGIGKTRLVVEFARELHEQGAAVLWGRSFEEALTPYQPFVHGLGHYVRCASADELRDHVGPNAAVLARLLPGLQARVRTRVGVPDDEPEGERYRLFTAVAGLLASATADRPILFVLDDLQWADQGTLLLLKHLARDPGRAQLLLLGTYRQSEVGREHPLALVLADAERDRVVTRLELTGLEEDDIAAFIGGLTGWRPPPEVVRSLRSETSGNPFFLEEIVRHLDQLGLSGEPERFVRLGATVEELGVPGRVRELVGRRVQRLSAPTREALAGGAVIGSQFDSDVLAAVLATGSPALHSALDECVEAGLLVESPHAIGRYGFSHALIQQALYESLTRNRRAALHEQTAGALLALRPEAPALHTELVYHYARAGERHAREVVRHGRAAGEHALTLFAYEDAIRDLSAALAALDVAGDDPLQRAELLAVLGTAETRAADGAAARASFRESAELSAASGAWQTLVRAALGYGGGTHFGGVWDTFIDVDAELVRLLELALGACPTGDSHERVRLLARLAQALYWAPQPHRARSLSEEAIAMARRLGDSAAIAHALDSRIVAVWDPDHLDERRVLAEEMRQIGLDLRDHDIVLEALVWLITDALERGSIGLADELIAEHGRIAAELRQPYHVWFTEALHVMRAYLEGRFREALALYESALADGLRAHELNAHQVHLAQKLFFQLDQEGVDDVLHDLELLPQATAPVWRASKALALAGLDRRGEALEQVALVGRDGFASVRRDCLWMVTMLGLGRTVGHFDDPTHADGLYEQLLPFADRICVAGGPILCLGPISRILGMLARAAGRPGDALSHLADALERSRGLGSPPLVARTQLEAAKAHVRRGDTDDSAAAEQLLAEAAVTASTYGMSKVLHDIEALRARLGQGALA